MLCSFKKAIASSEVATAICLVNKQPTLERTMFGLYISDFGLAIITASILAASAVRNKAPKFPGFSNPSATKIKGFLDNFKSDNCNDFDFAIAIIPSVVSR